LGLRARSAPRCQDVGREHLDLPAKLRPGDGRRSRTEVTRKVIDAAPARSRRHAAKRASRVLKSAKRPLIILAGAPMRRPMTRSAALSRRAAFRSCQGA
jgi:hypothetical protein